MQLNIGVIAIHKDLLWSGLLDGTIDLVVSDHSPAPQDLKCVETGDFMKAWGGISSLQLGIPFLERWRM
jgi:allantoinase